MFTCPAYSSHTTPSTSRDMTTVSKMGHMIVVGLPKLKVLRQNPPDGSVSPKVNRVRDKVTQRVASSWYTRGPSERTQHLQAFYLSPDQEVSFPPLYVGWHLAIWNFPPGITQESHLKPPDPNLTSWWGGH
jgi:hypothetical protein